MEKIKWYLEHYQTSIGASHIRFEQPLDGDNIIYDIVCVISPEKYPLYEPPHKEKDTLDPFFLPEDHVFIPFHIRPTINFKQGFTKTLKTWFAAAICMIHLKYGSWNRWYARLRAKKYGEHTDFWYNGIGVLCTKPFSPSQKRRIIKTLYPRHTAQDYISLVNELNASGFNPIVKFRPWETSSFANVFRRYRLYKIVKYHTNK